VYEYPVYSNTNWLQACKDSRSHCASRSGSDPGSLPPRIPTDPRRKAPRSQWDHRTIVAPGRKYLRSNSASRIASIDSLLVTVNCSPGLNPFLCLLPHICRLVILLSSLPTWLIEAWIFLVIASSTLGQIVGRTDTAQLLAKSLWTRH
jgi:hypothetical protein